MVVLGLVIRASPVWVGSYFQNTDKTTNVVVLGLANRARTCRAVCRKPSPPTPKSTRLSWRRPGPQKRGWSSPAHQNPTYCRGLNKYPVSREPSTSSARVPKPVKKYMSRAFEGTLRGFGLAWYSRIPKIPVSVPQTILVII